VPVRLIAPYEVMSPDVAHRLPGVDYVDDDGVTTTISTRDREKVLRSLDELDLLGHVEVKGATLEDVFLTLTGREYRS
jgi:ABC-2 type transport system ATP-binding protein